MNYEHLFCKALLLTVAVECVVVYTMIQMLLPGRNKRYPIHKVICAGIIPSCLTLPYLWFILPVVITSFILRTYVGEGVIFVTEALVIRLMVPISLKYSFLVSLLANGASVLVGLILMRT